MPRSRSSPAGLIEGPTGSTGEASSGSAATAVQADAKSGAAPGPIGRGRLRRLPARGAGGVPSLTGTACLACPRSRIRGRLAGVTLGRRRAALERVLAVLTTAVKKTAARWPGRTWFQRTRAAIDQGAVRSTLELR